MKRIWWTKPWHKWRRSMIRSL